jgi:hypothetical protein
MTGIGIRSSASATPLDMSWRGNSLGFPGEAASMPLANPWHQLTEIPGKLLIFHLVSDIMYD